MARSLRRRAVRLKCCVAEIPRESGTCVLVAPFTHLGGER